MQVSLNPHLNSDLSHIRLAVTLALQGDVDRAIGLISELRTEQIFAEHQQSMHLSPVECEILSELETITDKSGEQYARNLARARIDFLAGRPLQAINQVKTLASTNGKSTDAEIFLVKCYLSVGQGTSALQMLDEISVRPSNTADQLNTIGEMYAAVRNYDRAIKVFQQALRLTDNVQLAMFNIANTLKVAGKLDKALEAYDRILKLTPNHVECLNNRGAVKQTMDRDEEAIADFQRINTIDPKHHFAWINLGASLYKLNLFEEAVEAFDQALAIDPFVAEIIHNRGLSLLKIDQAKQALVHFKSMLLFSNEQKKSIFSQGNALHALQRYSEAVEKFQQLIDLFPDYTDAHINQAGSLQELGRHDEAIQILNEALQVRPNYSEALWNKANSMLQAGPSREAWQAYEHRLHISVGDSLPSYGIPVLGEQDLSGKKILVQWEQRFGDVLQMLRYFPVLSERCECFWQLSEPLADIARASFPTINLCKRDECPPDLDARTPYTSLPLNLKSFDEVGIPKDIPYLKPSEAALKRWEERKALFSGKIGIVWRGNTNPPGRTVPIGTMEPLFDKFADHLVSLQMDVTKQEEDVMNKSGVSHIGDEISNFDDSAAIISGLEAVVTIDTAIAHLAGAMGANTCVMLKYGSDWRWMQARDNNPWYPSAHLLRQSDVGDWSNVVKDVESFLGKLV